MIYCFINEIYCFINEISYILNLEINNNHEKKSVAKKRLIGTLAVNEHDHGEKGYSNEQLHL